MIPDFKTRVRTATNLLLLRETGNRDFDDCFEQYDGHFVVASIMRKAEMDLDLQSAILSMFTNCETLFDTPWTKSQLSLDHLSDAELIKAAAQERSRVSSISTEQMALEF